MMKMANKMLYATITITMIILFSTYYYFTFTTQNNNEGTIIRDYLSPDSIFVDDDGTMYITFDSHRGSVIPDNGKSIERGTYLAKFDSSSKLKNLVFIDTSSLNNYIYKDSNGFLHVLWSPQNAEGGICEKIFYPDNLTEYNNEIEINPRYLGHVFPDGYHSYRCIRYNKSGNEENLFIVAWDPSTFVEFYKCYLNGTRIYSQILSLTNFSHPPIGEISFEIVGNKLCLWWCPQFKESYVTNTYLTFFEMKIDMLVYIDTIKILSDIEDKGNRVRGWCTSYDEGNMYLAYSIENESRNEDSFYLLKYSFPTGSVIYNKKISEDMPISIFITNTKKIYILLSSNGQRGNLPMMICNPDGEVLSQRNLAHALYE